MANPPDVNRALPIHFLRIKSAPGKVRLVVRSHGSKLFDVELSSPISISVLHNAEAVETHGDFRKSKLEHS
jgi:hypothetical protein